jgi:tetratricopeptide (TPR) repeat protein
MALNVFICYESTTGNDYAEHLKAALEKSKNPKLKVFVANKLLCGKEWREEIDNALEKAHFFIVIITALSADSEEVEKEYKRALKLNKRIIPLRHSGVSLSEMKELSKFQQIDFKNNSELANSTINEIKKILKDEDEKEIEKDPEEFFRRGNLSFNLIQLNDALESYDKSIELKPDHVDAWNNKGLLLIKLDNYEEAINCFDHGLKIIQTPYLLNNKAIALSYLNKSSEAMEFYEKAISLNPNSYQALSNKGLLLSNANKLEEALECYNEAIKINRNNASIWSNRAIVLKKLGKDQEALESHDTALKLEPNSALLWYNKGNLLMENEKNNDAIECYNKALKLKPKLHTACLNKGKIFFKTGLFNEAIECYNKTIKIMPNSYEAWYNKGVTFIKLKRFKDAIHSFDKAISLDINPKLTETWFGKSVALLNIDKEKSLRSLNKVIELKPDFAEAWYNKACIQYSVKINKQSALKSLSKAIELDPELKVIAKEDEDFRKLWQDKDFKNLVE